MKLASRLICFAAAAGLGFSPIVAHANTRAGQSTAIHAVAMEASHGPVGDDDALALIDASEFFIAMLLGAWVTGIVFIVAEDDNQSPGAN